MKIKWPSWLGGNAAPAPEMARPLSAKEDPRVAELRMLRKANEKLQRERDEIAGRLNAAVDDRNAEFARAMKLRIERDSLRRERDDLALRLGVATSTAALAECKAQTLRRW